MSNNSLRPPPGVAIEMYLAAPRHNPRLLTTAEAAARLGVSVHTLIGWRRPSDRRTVALRVTRIGRAVRYREDDIAAFIAARGTVPGAALPPVAAAA